MSIFYDALPASVYIEQQQVPVTEHKRMRQSLPVIEIYFLPNASHLQILKSWLLRLSLNQIILCPVEFQSLHDNDLTCNEWLTFYNSFIELYLLYTFATLPCVP